MAWYLTQSVYAIQDDPGNNRRLYRTDVYLNASGYNAYGGYSTRVGGSIAGTGFDWGGPSDVSLNNSGQVVATFDAWVYADANGWYGTVYADSWFNGGGGWAPGYITASASTGGFDYDRRPSAPSIGVTRNVDSVTATVGAVSSPAGTPTYYVQRSENGGAWGDQRTGQSVVYSGLTKGTTQQFRTWASNSDGSSGFTYSAVATIPNVPGAPSSITATTPSALSTTISIGTAADGGAGITGYWVQSSVDNGVTWAAAKQMTNLSYTFTGLTPGATYKFRTYAVNEMGSGAYAITPSTFVPAGGRRWTGTQWIPTATFRRWDGTKWVDVTIANRWDGTRWVPLT